MSDYLQRCPKCGGEMDQGFMVDFTHGGQKMVSQWAAGAPRKSFWRGTKVPGKSLIPVGTFRCASCGFLEAYAREEFASQ